jgi:hypothetical protein
MLKDYIHSFFGQFIHEKENRSQVLILVTQQLSVAVHTIRSIHFHAIRYSKSVGLYQQPIESGQVLSIVRMLA